MTGTTYFNNWTEAVASLANQEDEQTRHHKVYLIFPAFGARARLPLQVFPALGTGCIWFRVWNQMFAFLL